MVLKTANQVVVQYFRRLDGRYLLLLLVGTALAVLIRISLLPFQSSDYLCCVRVWYYQVQTLGLRAFRHEFTNYNPPYLYLLYSVARLFPNLENLPAAKLPSIVADFICAGLASQIVRLKRQSRTEALLAYMAVLLAPTVILNSSFWGQSDSIYAVGILASLFAVLTRRPWLATATLGVALAFKLQAVFFLPFLGALWLHKELGWRHWLAVPAVLLLAVVPAWLAGGTITSLATIYLRQAQDYTGLAMYAPTLYAWFPISLELFKLFLPAGLFFALAVVGIFVVLIAHSKVRLTRQLLISLAAACLILVPFVTPKMHERYFYLADLVSILFAFYVPSYFFVALIVNLSSFFSYAYIPHQIPEAWLALAMLFALAAIVRHCLLQLYPSLASGSDGPPHDQPAVVA